MLHYPPRTGAILGATLLAGRNPTHCQQLMDEIRAAITHQGPAAFAKQFRCDYYHKQCAIPDLIVA